LDSPEDTIINLSFGGRFYAEQSLLHVEIAAKQARGAVVVASAGNDASCEPSYPAAFPGVIAVGALDGAGKPAAFTNYGSWVNASALGADLVSRFLIPTTAQLKVPKTADSDVAEFEDGWAAWSGTSFAAPVVAAAIARSMQDAGHTAKEAAAAVLAGGSDVACLGRRVEHPNRPAVHVASGNSS
jgi:subtilisin family serine protease